MIGTVFHARGGGCGEREPLSTLALNYNMLRMPLVDLAERHFLHLVAHGSSVLARTPDQAGSHQVAVRDFASDFILLVRRRLLVQGLHGHLFDLREGVA